MEPVGAGLRPRPVWGGRWRFCRGRPACRPVGGFWAEAFPGGHMGPPLRGGGGVPKPTEIGAETDLANGAGRSPPPTGGSGSGPAAGRAWGVAGCGHPALREQRRWCVAAGRCGHRPLRIEGEVSATTRASSAQRSVCAAGAKKWVGIATEVTPKGASNAGQSLSHGCAVPAPFTQGSLALRGMGDADCRVASLLAMTVLILCHSEEAQRADVGIRPFYDGRGFGPPSRRPLRVVAESRRNHPGSALSAEREAGQIRSLPDDLGVQHGVQGSEV